MAAIEISQNGATAVAEVGDEIVLRLPENATTGYRWEVERIDGPLRVESSEHVPPGGPAAPGAAGERVVRLRATGHGSGTVRLGLARPWQPEAAERFQAAVTVRGR